MRNRTIISIAMSICALVAVLAAFPAIASAQSKTPTWLDCPQCQTPEQRAAARARSENLPFNPRDLTGVWNQNRVQLSATVPSMTAEGLALYNATKSDVTEDGTPISNSKDGMLICDPLGWPRWFTYNYGMELAQLPDRMIQFLEWGHTFRTIWTDGRKLPEDPDPRWLGYSVGRWEGDTFIIESNGFDERSWLSENRQARQYGWPHSDQLRTEERYKRVNHNTLEVTLTITDPKIFNDPWVTYARILRSPETEIGEYFCVPSDASEHTNRVIRPAVGITQQR
jgi:hypothetical protein